MRATALAILLCGLPAGCAGQGGAPMAEGASPAASSSWKVEQRTSRLTDKQSLSMTTVATSARVTRSTGFQTSILSVSCGDGKPLIMFYWAFPVGRDRVAFASYRFDSLPAVRPEVSFLGTDAFVIADGSVSQFIEQLRSARTLYVEVNSVVGQATADFAVSGADAYLPQVIGECRIPARAVAAKRQRSK